MGSGLDDEPRLGAPDAAAQAATPAEAVVEADAEASGTPQRTDIDWYREIQSFYDASLQQGYSAGETQNWLREGYPTLMEGFLSWYQVLFSPPSIIASQQHTLAKARSAFAASSEQHCI